MLNPGSNYGKEITVDEAATIVDGSILQTDAGPLPSGSQMMIGQAAPYPTELVEALTRLFKKKPQVKRAWLAHVLVPGRDQNAHSLIGLEASGNIDEVLAEAGLVASQVNIPDPPVDFLLVTGRGASTDISQRDGAFL